MAHGFNATFLKLLHEDIAEALRELPGRLA